MKGSRFVFFLFYTFFHLHMRLMRWEKRKVSIDKAINIPPAIHNICAKDFFVHLLFVPVDHYNVIKEKGFEVEYLLSSVKQTSVNLIRLAVKELLWIKGYEDALRCCSSQTPFSEILPVLVALSTTHIECVGIVEKNILQIISSKI